MEFVFLFMEGSGRGVIKPPEPSVRTAGDLTDMTSERVSNVALDS
jgi:hypothetical protein